jgi:hypothetical protein
VDNQKTNYSSVFTISSTETKESTFNITATLQPSIPDLTSSTFFQLPEILSIAIGGVFAIVLVSVIVVVLLLRRRQSPWNHKKETDEIDLPKREDPIYHASSQRSNVLQKIASWEIPFSELHLDGPIGKVKCTYTLLTCRALLG